MVRLVRFGTSGWNLHENNHLGLCPPEHFSRAGTTKMDSCSFHDKVLFVLTFKKNKILK